MTDNHPITIPQDLITKWIEDEETPLWKQFQEAARWGADQELEACCAWTAIVGGAEALRNHRRPKPPSLKEQALEALMRADGADHPVPALVLSLDEAVLIRRALEQLDD